MQLSDHDIRDINKFLTEGKPLPDKYRFLLFEDKREVELVWNGKTNEVNNIVLPFQTVETIDEPRSDESVKFATQQYSMFDTRGRQLSGWKNKLIWGDNKLILSSLKNGPLREEIENNGGIKLIYIDPPFSAGIDYSISVEIGDSKGERLVKAPSMIEEFAYRNTWGNGGNTFIQMLYERIKLMRDLLAEEGIFIMRIDHHWGHYAKIMLDEIFGKEFFQSEVVINRIKKNVTGQGKLSLPVSTDSLFVYFRSEKSKFVHITKLRDSVREGYWRRTDDSAGERRPRERKLFNRTFSPPPGKHFKFSQSRMEEMIEEGRLRYNERLDRLEYFVEPSSTDILDTNWTDIPGYAFTTGYPTENSETLLERIIDITTSEGNIVADFFCGSGSTVAVAEKMNRKWITTDVGKFSIHTTRKRMIDVQRQMKKDGKDYRAFEVLNIGKYERQYYVGLNPTLQELEQEEQMQKKNSEYVDLILSAYKANKVNGFSTFVGEKMSRLIAIGSINIPVTSSFVNQCIKEASEKGITKMDILGFEFEMNLAPRVQEEAKEVGIDLMLKYIPRDVFDKRAIEKGQVEFYDVAYIEVKPYYKGKTVAIELTDFSVFYNQNSGKEFEQQLKNKSSKVVVEKGQIIKVSKDKDGIISKEPLTKTWSDWIDYWSVDFDYQSKKEVLKVKDEKGENQTIWTGDYTFENEWQTFRTKNNRDLELKTNSHEYPERKRYKIAIKVVDIFGNDTMKVIDVSI